MEPAQIGRLTRLRNLRRLHLYNICDKHVEWLIKLDHLEYLSLTNHNLSEAARMRFHDALPSTRIREAWVTLG